MTTGGDKLGDKDIYTMVEWGKGENEVSKEEACGGKAEDTLETQRHMANEVIKNARSSKASLLKASRKLSCPR